MMNLIALEHDGRRVIEADAHASATVVKKFVVDDVDGRLRLDDQTPEAVLEYAAVTNVTCHVILHRDAEGAVVRDAAVAQSKTRHVSGHIDALVSVALDFAVNSGCWSRVIPYKNALT